eukprot:CAMPEP_0170195976 /NCGR_PEP_ID=MMETSP0040_2-20121228/62755_1 /TAXON_ID=641309 /ORGANISM="Lotharella oceanica, Strain CCMP622" /LENGTH=90 /DNA_ID=CAMNT_0010445279 /DNA_START=510 /DNA_END=779 /DNA_ORIENTATION=+
MSDQAAVPLLSGGTVHHTCARSFRHPIAFSSLAAALRPSPFRRSDAGVPMCAQLLITSRNSGHISIRPASSGNPRRAVSSALESGEHTIR